MFISLLLTLNNLPITTVNYNCTCTLPVLQWRWRTQWRHFFLHYKITLNRWHSTQSTAALVSDSSEKKYELQNVAELVCAVIVFFSSHSFIYLTRIETPSQHFKIYNFNYHANFWRGSFEDPIKAYMCLHGRRGATKANEITPIELTKHMKCLNQATLSKSK